MDGMPRILILMCAVMFCSLGVAMGQGNVAATISLKEALHQVAERNQITITFQESRIEGLTITGEVKEGNAAEALYAILKGKGWVFVFTDPAHVVLLPSAAVSEDMARLLGLNKSFEEKNKTAGYDDFFEGFNEILSYEIKGRITDGATDEVLSGITLMVENASYGATTNQQGNFHLTLPVGKHTLHITGLGFQPLTHELVVNGNSSADFKLFEETQELDEVVISGSRTQETALSLEGSVEKIPIQLLTEMPAFLGEVDILKSITSLPGVSYVGEGAGGFNVRGGSADENLILLNGIPIFNSSHLFGFFSVFNPDVVEGFTLYKGGIPAKYGGRISSVLDVESRSGYGQPFTITGGIGPVTGKVTVEGPLLSEKTGFLIGARAAYPHWIMNKVRVEEVNKSSASFVDINTQIDHYFNESSKISLTSYFSTDQFALSGDTTFSWKNAGASLQWTHHLSNTETVEIRTVYSDYQNRIEGHSDELGFKYLNKIGFSGLKASYFKFFNNNDILETGIEVNHYNLKTGELSPAGANSHLNQFLPSPDRALESSVFLQLEKQLNKRISVLGGLRGSLFAPHGPDSEWQYEDNLNPSLRSATEIKEYGPMEIYALYWGAEPRINIKYTLDENAGLRFSYTRNRQNIHMISNTLAIAPTDYWKLNDNFIRPTLSDQLSLGYFKNFEKGAVTLEPFYKNNLNLLDYLQGTAVFLNKQLETAVINTAGKSWGMEMKLEKGGLLNGWISYTYTNSRWLFDDGKRLDTQFGHIYFPADHVKPHVLSVNANYKLSRRLSLSANFYYSTGRPVTIPESGYGYFGRIMANYSDRNAGRVPDYHRADIALVLKSNLKKQKLYDAKWVLSVYNVYARRNPFSVFFATTPSGILPQAYKLSILGTAFPSITYNFKIIPGNG